MYDITIITIHMCQCLGYTAWVVWIPVLDYPTGVLVNTLAFHFCSPGSNPGQGMWQLW